MSKLVHHVMAKVEEAGFRVVHFVSNSHKANVSAVRNLCGGFLPYRIEYPYDPDRLLFHSFDYCHIGKNIRSHILSRELGKNGEVSSPYVKKLYEMQEWLKKPLRSVTGSTVTSACADNWPRKTYALPFFSLADDPFTKVAGPAPACVDFVQEKQGCAHCSLHLYGRSR